MRLIDRKDIESWAQSYQSKGYFPVLLSRLVRATTPINTIADFPSGTTVFVSGWDAIVNCSTDNGYVPEGISLWEFGTSRGLTSSAVHPIRHYTT